MLKNVSKETIELKWTGVVVSLNPGDCCDVTKSFGVEDKQIIALEDRFVSKFKNKIQKYVVKKETEEPAPVVAKKGKPKKR